MAGKQSNLHRNPLEHGTLRNYSLLKRKENTAVGLEGVGGGDDKGLGTLSVDASAFNAHLRVCSLAFDQVKNGLQKAPPPLSYHVVSGLLAKERC